MHSFIILIIIIFLMIVTAGLVYYGTIYLPSKKKMNVTIYNVSSLPAYINIVGVTLDAPFIYPQQSMNIDVPVSSTIQAGFSPTNYIFSIAPSPTIYIFQDAMVPSTSVFNMTIQNQTTNNVSVFFYDSYTSSNIPTNPPQVATNTTIKILTHISQQLSFVPTASSSQTFVYIVSSPTIQSISITPSGLQLLK